MRRLGIALIALALVLVFASPAAAAGEHPMHACADLNGDGVIDAVDFALHIIQHAEEGMLSGEHNPGRHNGYSICILP